MRQYIWEKTEQNIGGYDKEIVALLKGWYQEISSEGDAEDYLEKEGRGYQGCKNIIKDYRSNMH